MSAGASSRNASSAAFSAEPRPQFPQPTARDIYTFGFRLKSAPGEFGPWDYGLEAFGQLGNFLDNRAGALSGSNPASPGAAAAPSAASSLLPVVLSALGGQQLGGIAGLVQLFNGKGLGDIVASWVSTGPNKPVSPDQVQQALGPDLLRQIGGQAGLPQEQTASALSQLLPALVDKATPDGQLPAAGAPAGGLESLLKGLF